MGGVAHTLPLGTSSQANFGHFPSWFFYRRKTHLEGGNFDNLGGEKINGDKKTARLGGKAGWERIFMHSHALTLVSKDWACPENFTKD